MSLSEKLLSFASISSAATVKWDPHILANRTAHNNENNLVLFINSPPFINSLEHVILITLPFVYICFFTTHFLDKILLQLENRRYQQVIRLFISHVLCYVPIPL